MTSALSSQAPTESPRTRLSPASGQQIELFTAVLAAYSEGPVRNDALYARVRASGAIAPKRWQERKRGDDGASWNVATRDVRWVQQTLKHMGLIEHVPGERGTWRAKPGAREALTPAPKQLVCLAFHTDLGIAVWGDCHDVISRIEEPIHCVVTSPPYPLARPRAYGNVRASEYVDFICQALEPVVERLAGGGSIALNISNDIFEPGSPARALYRERLVIALHERLGLHKMDEFIWHNPTKPPGPVRWASLQRVQLNVAWEPIYWFTNDPSKCFADNRRVLRPHEPQHLELIARGGEQRTRQFSDGAYHIRAGRSFAAATSGAIERNVLRYPHRCADQRPARDEAKRLGLPAHGAAMPLALAKFLIEFLTRPGQLVWEPFGGWLTIARAAEVTGRRWIASEHMREYLQAAAARFQDCAGYREGPALVQAS